MQHPGVSSAASRATSSPSRVQGSAASIPSPASWTLESRYEAYRRHQVREFLALLPRESLRGLYREARTTWEPDVVAVDPVARLGEFVDERLPLPPFDVWCQDVRTNPAAYLDEPWMVDVLPERAAPYTLDARVEILMGSSWRAELRVHYEGDGWLGHISFVRAADSRAWRTGDVFREGDALTLLLRFREFDHEALEAFLRSVVP
jgi:hypothetical protein